MNKEKVIDLNKCLKNKFKSINLWTKSVDKDFKFALEKFIENVNLLDQNKLSKLENIFSSLELKGVAHKVKEELLERINDLKVKVGELRSDKDSIEVIELQGKLKEIISKLIEFADVGTIGVMTSGLLSLLGVPTQSELNSLSRKVVSLEKRIKIISSSNKAA